MILNKNKRYLLIFSLLALVVPAARGMDNLPPLSRTKSSEGINAPKNTTVSSSANIEKNKAAQGSESDSSDQGYWSSWASYLKGWFTGKKEQEQTSSKSHEDIKKLALKAAGIGASTYATQMISSYFGTMPGLIIHGATQFTLLVLIQMYEAWQRGDLTSMQELKNILPIDVLTKSYWQKNKLLALLQWGCTAACYVTPYFGISSNYPVVISFFIQALSYDDPVKESLSANLYAILSSTSVKGTQQIIANLPAAAQAVFSSLSPSQIPVAAEGLLNLFNSNQTALAH